MAAGHLIVLLAFFLVGFSATVSIEENGPSEASSSRSYLSTSAESETDFIPFSRKGQRLRAAELKERDQDHVDNRGLHLHGSKTQHIREGLFRHHDYETDCRSHGFSHAVSLLEVTFGEADALLAFKDGIGSYSEGALDDWTPGKRSGYCSWTRVTCNRHLRVTALDLSHLNLTGSLGPSLCNLSYLEELRLNQNFLQSEIPPELGRLSRLRILDLEENWLHGKIPRALGNLTQLRHLVLGRNKFDGGIPEEFADLQKLEWLLLSDNELTGEIPASLGNLQNIVDIDLGSNNLTGSIPRQFSNLTNIHYLVLTMNHLTGEIPPELGKLRMLEGLYVDNNNLTGNLPVTLSNCSRLWAISLRYNSLTGQLTPINFGGNIKRSLRILSLHRNKFSGHFPDTLLNCSKLFWLDLSENQFSGELPKFDVFGGLFLPLTCNGMKHGNFYVLQVLSIASNYFGGSIPSSIWKLPILQVLDLSFNLFTGVLPQDLSRLSTYKLPMIPDTMIRFHLTISLRKGEFTVKYEYVLNALMSIDVSGNQLTGKIPAELGTLLGIRFLFMGDNNFEGSIPFELGELPKLSDLDLSRNQLSGPIPVSLSRLRLSYLNLSLNRLCGPIPVVDSFDTRFFQSFLPGNPKLCGDSINKTCESSNFSCGGDLHPDPVSTVSEWADSWNLYFHGVSMTAFAIGASVGFATVIGLITMVPTLRSRFLFPRERRTMDHAESDYGLFRRPS
ncbi:hypothetical protein Mp_7g08000 [Marchantia polymorpha subsp. ruderalis]|uniref:Leucine-rich repeat-containing N-terminal plant-type domain-containing protein n=2 Tax=Marchantia polymorpha TaxID=3197 RepID=A0AAF6BX96_MARPO|nr:hypothetical protein MARPO_2608s0001 [Marchantia polymorpha]BBN16630.1 hypothetical protein Mp_7g08000 [Marchantia polymorpha subsp. ruderalis]|eukprot:PTQ26350.1 hypothetical protein MARPO_2608s0001 [Marchantia polymorpha]